MKTLFILASVVVILFIAAPDEVQAQKKKTTKIKTGITVGAGCVVTVRGDLVPNRTFVVVGCHYFPSEEGMITNGGIVVLDSELQMVFLWRSCSACGWFSNFSGTKKFKGHNALMVKLDGAYGTITKPLYFDGKKFRFTE